MPDHVREAALADVALTHQQAVEAEERDKIRIYLATEQGLTTREIADQLEIGQTSVSKYAQQGKEAYERRQQARSQRAGQDPDGPTERGPNG